MDKRRILIVGDERKIATTIKFGKGKIATSCISDYPLSNIFYVRSIFQPLKIKVDFSNIRKPIVSKQDPQCY